jgi:hypothetical protein
MAFSSTTKKEFGRKLQIAGNLIMLACAISSIPLLFINPLAAFGVGIGGLSLGVAILVGGTVINKYYEAEELKERVNQVSKRIPIEGQEKNNKESLTRKQKKQKVPTKHSSSSPIQPSSTQKKGLGIFSIFIGANNSQVSNNNKANSFWSCFKKGK